MFNVEGKGVHSGHWVDFGSGVSGRFKIGFCVHIGFYIIIDPFLSRVKSNSVIKSDAYRVIRSCLNTSRRKYSITEELQLNKQQKKEKLHFFFMLR